MTGTGVHLFKIPNAAFCLPSSVTLQSTKESTCVWKLGWNTLSFLFYINVKSRKIELSSIFYQKRRARSFPRSEIFSEGQVDATLVLILSSALRKFTYAISSHIRLNTLVKTSLYSDSSISPLPWHLQTAPWIQLLQSTFPATPTASVHLGCQLRGESRSTKVLTAAWVVLQQF